MLEFHVFAQHRLLISSRIACPQRDRRWADAIRRRHQRSPVAAVPMLALTPTTLRILFHRDRASTTWAYLLVLHGIGLD